MLPDVRTGAFGPPPQDGRSAGFGDRQGPFCVYAPSARAEKEEQTFMAKAFPVMPGESAENVDGGVVCRVSAGL